MLSEWHRLNRMVLRDDVLRELPLEELYFRAFVHFQYNHFNVLLLGLLSCRLLRRAVTWMLRRWRVHP